MGTIEYFNEVEIKKFRAEPHILKFTEFPQWKNKKVLEVGCGLGTVGINFALNGANYTGVELSSESLEIAKKDLRCIINLVSFIWEMQNNFLILFPLKPMI